MMNKISKFSIQMGSGFLSSLFASGSRMPYVGRNNTTHPFLGRSLLWSPSDFLPPATASAGLVSSALFNTHMFSSGFSHLATCQLLPL